MRLYGLCVFSGALAKNCQGPVDRYLSYSMEILVSAVFSFSFRYGFRPTKRVHPTSWTFMCLRGLLRVFTAIILSKLFILLRFLLSQSPRNVPGTCTSGTRLVYMYAIRRLLWFVVMLPRVLTHNANSAIPPRFVLDSRILGFHVVFVTL